MGKYTGGKAWLKTLVVLQHGKEIEGEPTSGDYTIALKPGQELHGDPAAVVNTLQATFANCTFAWVK